MDGAQFHPPWVGEAGGRLIRNRMSILFSDRPSTWSAIGSNCSN